MAAVGRHGADEAGAILVVVDRLDETVDLYAQAPQSAFTDSRPADRLFQLLLSRVARSEIDRRLADELRFDPDLWVVEVEDRGGRSFLELAEP